MKNFSKLILPFLAVGLLVSSCASDFLETRSTSAVDNTEMFVSTQNAYYALNGLHRKMYTSGSSTAPRCGWGSYMLQMDFMGEDLVYTRSNAQWGGSVKWTTHRSPTNAYNSWLYGWFYDIILNANYIIENVDKAEGSQDEKDNIKGQALAYRAFCHFYLVQAWAKRYVKDANNTQPGIVVKISSDMDNLPRSSVEEVYKVINQDLDDAITLLGRTSIKRPDVTNINVYVAKALKARVLLVQGRWLEAASMAKDVIDHSGATLQSDTYDRKVGRMCSASNKEWLWAKIGQPTIETGKLLNFFSYISNTNVSYNMNTPRAIYNLLYDKISDTDVRKSLWLPNAPSMNKKDIALPPNGNYYKWISQKYLVCDPDNSSASYNGSLYTADMPYIRIPEMYLIAAEGYAKGGEEKEAAKILYPMAKSRDPQYTLSTKRGEDLLDEIDVQRRVELWGEGFRWLDLKRQNKPLDRGPAPRAGYNQGGTANGWGSGKTPKNLDPLASNFNMYHDKPFGEIYRYKAADDIEWEFVIPKSELDRNPLVEQNPL